MYTKAVFADALDFCKNMSEGSLTASLTLVAKVNFKLKILGLSVLRVRSEHKYESVSSLLVTVSQNTVRQTWSISNMKQCDQSGMGCNAG